MKTEKKKILNFSINLYIHTLSSPLSVCVYVYMYIKK